MVYRHMDIGTAKPDAALRAAVPHHLIDVRNPWEAYSAGEFRADAVRLIHEICDHGRVPLLVGGTMLYFRALFRGLAPLPRADAGLRAEIDREAAERGWAAMHAELARADPEAAARIRPADRQRIQRALEVFRLTGSKISRLQEIAGSCDKVRYLRIALVPGDRAALYRQLDQRLRDMLSRGFTAEVERLMKLPLMSMERPAMRAVGYRQIWKQLTGACTEQVAVRDAAIATHRLAKRQLTWLRSESADLQLDAPAVDVVKQVAEVFARAGVSRRALRCNIIDQPLECREYGV